MKKIYHSKNGNFQQRVNFFCENDGTKNFQTERFFMMNNKQ